MEKSRIIKVGQNKVGLIGLEAALAETAAAFKDQPDEKVEAELLRRLSEKNYIPGPAREDYGRALIREYKRFLGQDHDEGSPADLEIKVLGPGCAQCDGLERTIIEALTEMDLPADVEHVTDLKEIGRFGVMGVPALVINGQVKAVGLVPPKEKIKRWLKESNK